MRKRPLLLCACVFLAGLACCRYGRLEIGLLVFGWIGYECYCGMKNQRKKLAAGRSLVLLSVFLLGNLHMDSQMQFREAYLSKLSDGDKVTVWGEITKIEITAMGSRRLILSDCYISLEEGIVPCNDVMVYPLSNQYQVGEIHKITGKLNQFEKARNEGGFDSLSFYQSQKIDLCIEQYSGELIKQKSTGIANALFTLSSRMDSVYERSLSAKAAGFLSGMVLGDRSDVAQDLKQLFTNGGIAHILAISGLHVSIIGRGFYCIIRKHGVGFVTAGTLAGIVLLLYCYMVGSGMSAVRAVGMMLVFFVAQMLGRGYDMLNSLGAMCLYLLWENPFLLEYSGFWFSVLALIGVGYVGNVFSRLWEKGGGILMSLGISLTTLPVVAYCYYEIPLYSPVVNFLLLPVLTPIFILALLGGLVGLVFPSIAGFLLLPCEWGLWLYEWVCGMAEKLPGAIMIAGTPSWSVIIGYYVVLISGTFVLYRIVNKRAMLEKEFGKAKGYEVRKLRKKEILLAAGMAITALSLIIYPKPHKEEVTFLDVGQGDGIYICTGDGIRYFIDGGSINEQGLGRYCILPFLKSKDIERIDYWFVTHADNDHISGVLEVIRSGYDIAHLVVARAAPKDENMEKLLAAAKQEGIEIVFMQAGDVLVTKNTYLTCLYPEAQAEESLIDDRNDTSLVLEYVSKQFGGMERMRAIFTGDISTEVEKQLVDSGKLQEVWLYKAAHHGSKYSNSLEILKRLLPEVAVISCSENNVYGHPAPEAIERMREVNAKIFYTMYSGQITIREYKGNIQKIQYTGEMNYEFRK